MATQQELDLRINTSVDAGNSASSIRDIRKEIKELNSIALKFGEDFPEAARKAQLEAAKLSDKLDDTKEGLNDLKGEPIERLRASFSRLNEGIMTLDMPKVINSFKNLGSAVSAAGGPLALIASAVFLLVQHFDDLKNSGGIIGGIFTTIAAVGENLKNILLDIGDALGLINKAKILEIQQDEKSKESKDDLTKSSELYNKTQQRELELMRARGVEQDKILAKEKTIIDENLRKAQKQLDDLIKKQQEERKNRPAGGVISSALMSVPGLSGLGADIASRDIAERAVGDQKSLELLKEQISELQFQSKLREEQLLTLEKDNKEKEKSKNLTKDTIKEEEIGANKINKIRTDADIEFDRRNDKFLRNRDLQIEREKTIIDLNKQIKDSFVDVSDTPENKDYEELERIKQKEEAYKNLGSTFDKMAQNFNSGGNLIASSIARSFGGIRQSMSKAIDDFKNNSKEFAQSALSAASSLTSGIGDLLSANINQQIQDSKRQTDERLNDLNKQLNGNQTMLDEQLQAGLISEDEYNKRKTLYQEDFNQRKYELELAQFNKETELKRQAFEQNKAIQIVQAIILSTQAALAAYLSGMQAGGPFGPAVGGIFAGIAAAFGAIQVALIASQTFPGNGAGPTRATSPSAPSGGGGGGTIPNPVAIADIGGRLTTNNPQEEMRVYVLEKDITSAQNKSAQIKDRSRR